MPGRVRVTQNGEMCLKPGGRWLRFSAVEEFAVEEVAFSWRARFAVVPLVSLVVVDGYVAGEGKLEARLLGVVPVMRARGREVAEGEAIRYLAELPWVPQALGRNRALHWRELDDRTLEVTTPVGAGTVAVRLQFDADGDIVGALASRPRQEGKRNVTTPWRGVFSDYALVGGVRLPTHGEVSWELDDGPFTYWRGTITGLAIDQSPAQS